MLESEPKDIIEFVDKLKHDQYIDFNKVKFEKEVTPATKQAINMAVKNTKNKADFSFTKQDKIVQDNLANIEELSKYSYLFDKALSPYEKLSKYINGEMGEIFITVEELKSFEEEDIV